jgi:hypothetical protein
MCALVLLLSSAHTQDQTDREEHCSTLVGLASALLPKYIIWDCICIVFCTLCPPRKRTCSHDSTPELTLWCGDVVWCDVM